MKQIVLSFGLVILSLLVLFRLVSYARFGFGMETWLTVVGALFLVAGILISRKMFRKELVLEKKVFVETPKNIAIDPEQITKHGLSKREYEILLLITEGLSNQEISGRLFISENTTKKHVSSVFLKLGVERRTAAVSKAKALRLV